MERRENWRRYNAATTIKVGSLHSRVPLDDAFERGFILGCARAPPCNIENKAFSTSCSSFSKLEVIKSRLAAFHVVPLDGRCHPCVSFSILLPIVHTRSEQTRVPLEALAMLPSAQRSSLPSA